MHIDVIIMTINQDTEVQIELLWIAAYTLIEDTRIQINIHVETEIGALQIYYSTILRDYEIWAE